MVNDLNFEVFLFFSPEKIIISVNHKTDFKLIFKDEIFFENSSTQLNFNKLNSFLNENIFKIEKILGNFVEEINIIIETSDFFNLQISMKKHNYNENINYVNHRCLRMLVFRNLTEQLQRLALNRLVEKKNLSVID